MKFQNKHHLLWQALTLSGVLALSGCNSSDDDPISSSSTTVEGSIFAAPVAGATISVFDINGNEVAGPVSSDADGRYRVSIPNVNLDSDLSFVSSGGTFNDEASATTGVVAGEMSVYVVGGTLDAGDEVHATPTSTIMHELVMSYGQTPAEAATAIEDAFGYPVDFTIAPTDATAPVAGASDSEKLAGLRAAGFSQLTADLGLNATDQFALLAALAEDLSDGELDGQSVNGTVLISGSTPLASHIQHQFSMALTGFHGGAQDASGLTANQIGILPFAKVVNSASYRFEYQPGMMSAMEGKTSFKVAVSDAATGSIPQIGLTLTLQAKMYMATKVHMTPVDGCVESPTLGTYECTIFYLMPSVMNSMSMGYWQLMVTANSEMVSFYPEVGMGMNGNGKRKLMAQTTGSTIDVVTGLSVPIYNDFVMVNTTARKYFLFKDDITAGSTSGHKVRLFAATKESMDSFPVLYSGASFNMGSFTANPVVLEFSVDGNSWSAMSDEANGYWSIDDVPGLSDGVENTFYVRLTVNSEQKTADGNLPALDGSNDYAVFTTTLN